MDCRRKMRFHDLEQAERTAEIVAKQRAGEAGKVPCRVYECNVCGYYHFTSQPPRGGQRETTVAVLRKFVRPSAPVPALMAPDDPPPARPAPRNAIVLPEPRFCAWCSDEIDNGTGFGFPGRDGAYHRRCRPKAFKDLPQNEQRRILIAWSLEGKAGTA